MGFMSATLRDYIEYEFAFFSKREYLNTKLINEKLELLYFSTRDDDDEKLNFLLDKVEEMVNKFDEETELRIGEEKFKQHFIGIVKFLNEAGVIKMNIENEISKQISEYIKKRFISVSEKLLKYCSLTEL